MPSLRFSSRPLAFASLLLYLYTLPAGIGQEPFQVKFRVVAQMIVVPVTIDGASPCDFQIDTGSTDTIIDRKLAEELHLPSAGTMVLKSAQGDASTPLVHTEWLAIGGATVRGLNLSVVNHYANFQHNVRGILGEDFLRSFDLLIDNRRHLIHLESGAGPLADRLTGEHLPLSLNGFYEHELTRNRLVVVGHIHELGDKNVNLQLDSGTASVVLFTTLNTSTLVPGASSSYSVAGIFGPPSLVDPQTSRFLRLGGKVFRDLPVFVPRGKIPPMDVDGFLPIALFQSIFISHSGRFVILDPSTKAGSRAIKVQDSKEYKEPVAQFMRRESPE